MSLFSEIGNLIMSELNFGFISLALIGAILLLIGNIIDVNYQRKIYFRGVFLSICLITVTHFLLFFVYQSPELIIFMDTYGTQGAFLYELTVGIIDFLLISVSNETYKGIKNEYEKKSQPIKNE